MTSNKIVFPDRKPPTKIGGFLCYINAYLNGKSTAFPHIHYARGEKTARKRYFFKKNHYLAPC